MPHERHPITGCAAKDNFLGLWFIEPDVHERLTRQGMSYNVQWLVEQSAAKEKKNAEIRSDDPSTVPPAPRLPYAVSGKTAIVTISGATTKYPHSLSDIMGGSSTVMASRALIHARTNPDIDRIMYHVDDCPGGTVAGSFDHADDIRKTASIKPLHVHVDDYGTSGGMLFATQGTYVTANSNAILGSIGVRSHMVDTSEKFSREGVKVIPIVSGKLKAAGMPGTKITPEMIKHEESKVNQANDLFIQHVSEARGIDPKVIRNLEAGTFLAAKAQELGLIDEICRFEDALAKLQAIDVSVPYVRPARKAITNRATKAGSPAGSKTMALNSHQIKTIRQAIPGAADVQDDALEGFLADVAPRLATESKQHADAAVVLRTQLADARKQAPIALDPEVRTARVETAMERVQLMLEKQQIVPEQFGRLEAAFKIPAMADFLVTPVVVDDAGKKEMPYRMILGMFEENKPNGLLKNVSKSQPAPRTEPGNESGKNKKPTLQEVNKGRTDSSLAPWTMAEYDNYCQLNGLTD